jgi:hypothetical protein
MHISFYPVFLLLSTPGALAARIARNDPSADSTTDWSRKPIILSKTGGFQIGGRTIHNPLAPNQTLSCDHGYVEYFHPHRPRSTSLVLWHSSSTQVWQNRWDGGPGFKDLFLRRAYPIYLWDGPRVGRANWGCANYTYVPGYRDEGNFVAWNFGPRWPVWWNDTQFPARNREAWKQATSARYHEFDNDENVQLHSSAAAVAADSGKLGENIVYLTNSAGGLRAQLTAVKAQKANIRGIVTYESVGYVFPDTYNTTRFPHVNGFGPFIVPLAQFKKLARLTAIQFVWGDHRDESYSYVQQSREVAKLINQYGGKASVLMLGEAGLKGSSHIPFADMDNEKVASLLDRFLAENELNGYAEEEDGEEEE